jgi:hypothetical protein
MSNIALRLRALDAQEDYDSVIDDLQQELSDAWEEYESGRIEAWYDIKACERRIEAWENRINA